MRIYQSITVDINSPISINRVYVKQGDSLRGLRIRLTNGCEVVPLADFTAQIFIKKPSGLKVFNYGTVSGDWIQIDLTTQAVAEVGDHDVEVRLISADNGVLSTPCFCMEVQRTNFDDDGFESTNEFSALEAATQAALAAAEAATQNTAKFG